MPGVETGIAKKKRNKACRSAPARKRPATPPACPWADAGRCAPPGIQRLTKPARISAQSTTAAISRVPSEATGSAARSRIDIPRGSQHLDRLRIELHARPLRAVPDGAGSALLAARRSRFGRDRRRIDFEDTELCFRRRLLTGLPGADASCAWPPVRAGTGSGWHAPAQASPTSMGLLRRTRRLPPGSTSPRPRARTLRARRRGAAPACAPGRMGISGSQRMPKNAAASAGSGSTAGPSLLNRSFRRGFDHSAAGSAIGMDDGHRMCRCLDFGHAHGCVMGCTTAGPRDGSCVAACISARAVSAAAWASRATLVAISAARTATRASSACRSGYSWAPWQNARPRGPPPVRRGSMPRLACCVVSGAGDWPLRLLWAARRRLTSSFHWGVRVGCVLNAPRVPSCGSFHRRPRRRIFIAGLVWCGPLFGPAGRAFPRRTDVALAGGGDRGINSRKRPDS